MKRIVHYTSKEKWDKALASGMLLPKSHPYAGRKEHIPKKPHDCVRHEKYLVGIPEVDHPGWVEYDLMPHIVNLTTGEVVLDVPIINSEDAFVRDHSLLSPKRSLDMYGIDFFETLKKGSSFALDGRFSKAVKEYFDSSIRLCDYTGDYAAPEIWLPQETPSKVIKEMKKRSTSQ